MFLSWHGFWPVKKAYMQAPKITSLKEISIVIPVKNNQSGINLFLRYFFKTHKPRNWPLEIIIVNNANSPVYIPTKYNQYPLDIKVLKCKKEGPASARNLGWRKARGEWILFTDSDCIPSLKWIEGYLPSINGSIGYAGMIRPFGDDVISRYYGSQRILVPTSYKENEVEYPEYIITANSLIWRKALIITNGFNETINIAAGEDIDLGFRLREIGNLSYAPHSVIYHNFEDGILGFIKRFRRYGKGNRIIAEIHSLNMKPQIFKPNNMNIQNIALTLLQYLCLSWGFRLYQ